MSTLSIILFIIGAIGYFVCFMLDEGHLFGFKKEASKYHKLWTTLGIIFFVLIMISFFV